MTDRPSYEQLSDDMRRTTEYAIAGAKFQDARIAALTARNAELEAALDSGETCNGMWRFWSDKAQQLAEKNKRQALELLQVHGQYADQIAAMPAMEWQDISTAPKDVLIDIWLTEGRRWCDCYYDSICDEWRTSRPSGKLVWISARYVSHWMHQPAAPTQEGGQ